MVNYPSGACLVANLKSYDSKYIKEMSWNYFGGRMEGVPGLHDITQPPGLLLDAMPMEIHLGVLYQVLGLGCFRGEIGE